MSTSLSGVKAHYEKPSHAKFIDKEIMLNYLDKSPL